MLGKIIQFIKNFQLIEGISTAILDERIEKLKALPKHSDPKCLIPYGYKIYSQSEEDGMIAEIFNRIGVTNRFFVEFGVGNGLENNTLALLFQGWKGLWIEASTSRVKVISKKLPKTISSGKLKVINAFITTQNINELIKPNVSEESIDLLSVDIDGNDFNVFSAISCIKPRLVVIEYNAKFPPPILYQMQYKDDFIWQETDCLGISIKSLEIGMKEKGYSLVGCNLSGANAFFVKDELVKDHFLEPFTAENHYQPVRYYLIKKPSGHRPSFDTLDTARN